MKEARRAADHFNLVIAGGNTWVSEHVTVPVFDLTVLGKKLITANKGKALYEEGEDIIMTKWAGLWGTSLLAEREGELLKQTLPGSFITTGKEFSKYVSILPESRIGIRENVSGMHDVSRGGIFAALWELTEYTGQGFTVDLKKIPMRQETIEICERLKINPYELEGSGSLLLVTKEKDKLLKALKEAGIPAAAIGKITEGKTKLIVNREETRCLDRPVRDSFYLQDSNDNF